ncbi:hypothetical protein [Streptomyces sp. NPDC001315]|uniref:hypothetical protein n=1 Tax=Streptomyces sp. NPDC001315 TaxID=3364562 RepID=UPI0036816462
MTWPAALPGAALRVLRTAAGRRALQVALLVGGLFALGFLCGEQAHAAEGPTSLTSTSSTSASTSTPAVPSPLAVPSAVTDGVGSLTQGTPGTLTADKPVVRPVGSRVAASVQEEIAHPVAEAVTQPVGKVVNGVAEGLMETRAQVSPLPSLPALPAAPSLPGLPSLPGRTLPAPGTTAAQPAGSAEMVSSGGRTEQPAPTDSYGPRPAVDGIGIGIGTGTAAGLIRHRPAHAGQAAPAHPAPTGDPDGALVNQSALDNGTSRHGDAHAVPPNRQAPLRLVPGTAARADAAGTRDRYRDIPVFPA